MARARQPATAGGVERRVPLLSGGEGAEEGVPHRRRRRPAPRAARAGRGQPAGGQQPGRRRRRADRGVPARRHGPVGSRCAYKRQHLSTARATNTHPSAPLNNCCGPPPGGMPPASRTALTISATLAMAPRPSSPHARTLTAGSTTLPPHAWSSASCGAVAGCSHMDVFMAGARSSGLEKVHARATQVSRLSAWPPASLASVLAERGAMSRRSAHLRS